MVWSLSKDDDGLDSVLPLADDPSVAQPAPLPQPVTAVPVQPKLPDIEVDDDEKTRVFDGGTPSIVVDPQSQVPEVPDPARKRRSVEKTLVLKGRKLDNLRAEVAKRRVAHQRKKQKALFLWAGAGALALCMGWGVGLAFSPEDAEDASPGATSDETASPAEANAQSVTAESAKEASASAEPQNAEPQQAAKQETGKRAELGTLSLEDLPEEGEEDEASDDVGDQAQDGAAFTLDDLPSD